MDKKAIFFDKDRCVGCYACIIACKMKHNAPPYPTSPPEGDPRGLSPINVHEYGPVIKGDRVFQFFQPLACMHCQDAPCIQACPVAAIFRDPEMDVVLVDREKCIGCKFCLWVCPYGAPHFDDVGKMVKCDMCVERLREGKRTACQTACIARAITVASPEEIAQIQAKKAIHRVTREMPD